MPHAKGMEIVGHRSDHESLVATDSPHGDPGLPNVQIEFEQIQIESGCQNADIALYVLATGQHDGVFGKSLDCSGLERDFLVAQFVLQSDCNRNTLLPWVIAGAEVPLHGLCADRSEPMTPENPSREAGEPSECNENEVVLALKVIAQQLDRKSNADFMEFLA